MSAQPVYPVQSGQPNYTPANAGTVTGASKVGDSGVAYELGPTPRIGDIVMYNDPDTKDTDPLQPAMVQNVSANGAIRLTVFGPSIEYHRPGVTQGLGLGQWRHRPAEEIFHPANVVMDYPKTLVNPRLAGSALVVRTAKEEAHARGNGFTAQVPNALLEGQNADGTYAAGYSGPLVNPNQPLAPGGVPVNPLDARIEANRAAGVVDPNAPVTLSPAKKYVRNVSGVAETRMVSTPAEEAEARADGYTAA